jgi:hypothetical protein
VLLLKGFFGKTLPARTTVQVGLGELRVEIDAIAVRRRVPDRGASTTKYRHPETKR